MPRVSVIVPTYNRAERLPRAIDSVLAQSEEAFELVIVDDGSSDETSAVVEAYRDGRIEYIRFPMNKGQNVARNAGLRNARGQYISYLDSDDELHPNHLERMADELDKTTTECAGVFSGFTNRENGQAHRRHVRDGRLTRSDLLASRSDIGGLSGLTFKSDVLDRVGYHDESIVKATDLDFYLQLLDRYHLIGVDANLYTRYIHDSNVSREASNVMQGEEIILDKYGSELASAHKAKRYYHMGKAAAEERHMEDARDNFLRSAELAPRNPKYWYHLAIAFGGEKTYQLGRSQQLNHLKRKVS